ncbi:UNKNOWN [Stylonychia lemnae]|uniref:Uncharacterized protein n=1 Tax=Stylonychia lemnae TaxID=5949 RepID=A0A078ACY5_STYLE|nr:UNKNOWN [Stylonychia lemnae]|eukprot:CDW79397.1 UNKNOWN [Stylonychia lemnae]
MPTSKFKNFDNEVGSILLNQNEGGQAHNGNMPGINTSSQHDLINSFEYGSIKNYIENQQKRRLQQLTKDQFLNLNYHKRKSIIQKKLDEKQNEIVNDQTMSFFIKKCFSGNITPKKVTRDEDGQISYIPTVSPLLGHKKSSVPFIEEQFHQKLLKFNYPQIFTKNFRAKELDKSFEKLSMPQKYQLLESVINYLDQDFMELRDQNEVSRKEFVKKMQEERLRQLYKKRDPSPSDVLVPIKQMKKRNINQSGSLSVIKRKNNTFFLQRDLGFDGKNNDRFMDDGRIAHHRSKAMAS